MKIELYSAESVRLIVDVLIIESRTFTIECIKHEYMDYNEKYIIEIK